MTERRSVAFKIILRVPRFTTGRVWRMSPARRNVVPGRKNIGEWFG